jgi:hypothetical protein
LISISDGTPALQYPYVIAFEPTFIEVHHVETGHLVQIIPASGVSCLFADTPPSRVNAPLPPPNRQLMFPPQQQQQAHGSQFRPNPQMQGFGTSGGMRSTSGNSTNGFQQQPQQGYGGMPRFSRPQVIFTRDDGHVQFLKFPAPQGRGAVGVAGVAGGSIHGHGAH